MRAKHLAKALLQLAEEGAAQVFRARHGSDWIVGVAGALQFEVLADRIRSEYNIAAVFEAVQVSLARWVEADDHREIQCFIEANETKMAEDHNRDPVFLTSSSFYLDRAREDWPAVRFLKLKEQVQ